MLTGTEMMLFIVQDGHAQVVVGSATVVRCKRQSGNRRATSGRIKGFTSLYGNTHDGIPAA